MLRNYGFTRAFDDLYMQVYIGGGGFEIKKKQYLKIDDMIRRDRWMGMLKEETI